MGIDVLAECKILRLLPGRRGPDSPGAVGYMRPTGEMVVFTAKAFILATGSDRQVVLVHLQLVGVGGRRPRHAHSWAGADVIDMECVQFHPTGMVWPLSVRGILVTEGVRGDGGRLRNSEGKRHMFDYIADILRRPRRRRRPKRKPTAGTTITSTTAAPPTSCPATRWPAPSTRRSRRAGARRTAGCISISPHAAHPSTSGVASRRCTTSSWSWPGWTSPPARWKWAPPATGLLMMGGCGSTPRPRRPRCPASSPSARCRAACTGRTASAGTRLDLIVFGRRAGIGAADFAEGARRSPSCRPGGRSPSVIDDRSPCSAGRAGTTPTTSSPNCRRPCSDWSASSALAPSSRRPWPSWRTSRAGWPSSASRAAGPTTRGGTWPPTRLSMVTTSIAVAQGALNRKRVLRRAHPGGPIPGSDPEMGKVNAVQHQTATSRGLPGSHRHRFSEPLPEMPAELRELLEEGH